MLLNNYYWAVWSFMMLKDADIKNDKCWNYHFAAQRAQLQRHLKKEFKL